VIFKNNEEKRNPQLFVQTCALNLSSIWTNCVANLDWIWAQSFTKIAFFAPYVTLKPPFVTKMFLNRAFVSLETNETSFSLRIQNYIKILLGHLYRRKRKKQVSHWGYKIILKHTRFALLHTSEHKTHNFVPQLPKRPFFEISSPMIQNYVKTQVFLVSHIGCKTHNFVP
jgi:hypothetical protein